ncbi:MAG TPA: type III secretion system chaperone [Acidimicrobiales bacterium]|nr:type III secretion system chaperone [Acidimicrobiales bacterium]
MTRAPLSDADAASRLDETLTRWCALWHASSFVGEIEHQEVPDDKGHFHWLIRLKGEEKDVITLWLSLRQRTVYAETELMPAPEENREELYRYLMVKNHELRELHLAIGPEAGIYLVTQIPIQELSVERLDELVGATVHYVDEIFPTAMTMGLGSVYRRRKSR